MARGIANPGARGVAPQTSGLKLTRSLLLLLLEELAIDDDFDELVGNPEEFPASRFPQAIAMAIALRHSWRRDDFGSVVEALIVDRNSSVTPLKGRSPSWVRRD